MRAPLLLLTLLCTTVPTAAQIIAIDPAHGAPSDLNDAMRRESRFARLLAGRIADSLGARGIRSVITVTDSRDASLEVRTGRAKEAGATFVILLHSEPPNLLHSGARGTFVGDTTDARVLAVLRATRPGIERVIGGSMQLLQTDRLTAIRRFSIPGLMIKSGNNEDAEEMARLSADPALGELAGSIANAIR